MKKVFCFLFSLLLVLNPLLGGVAEQVSVSAYSDDASAEEESVSVEGGLAVSSASPLGEDASVETAIGRWDLFEVSRGGVAQSFDPKTEFIIIILYEDGRAGCFNFENGEKTGTLVSWEQQGSNVSIGNGSYQLKDGKLTWEGTDGSVWSFQRVSWPSLTLSTVEAENLEEFYGDWVPVATTADETGDLFLPAEYYLEGESINNYSISISSSSKKASVMMPYGKSVAYAQMSMSLREGKLHLEQFNIISANASLYENGWISLDFSSTGGGCIPRRMCWNVCFRT